MSFINIPAIEQAVKDRGWTMRDFLKDRAQISESTWYRWKDGVKPNTATIETVQHALDRLPVKKAKKARKQ